jgi:putative flippase GtrA
MNKVAALATLHCLAGCAIGEVLGMVLSTAWNWPPMPSVAFSVGLAFIFGYSLSIIPVLRHGISLRRALKLVLAADTLSIIVMEVTDNGFLLLVPGAIHAALDTPLFWVSLILSLVVAFIFAFPVNKFLIQRGKGHAVMHDMHHYGHSH